MNCPNCGKPLPEGALFCVACGARVPVEPVAAPQAAPQTPPVQPQYAPQQPYAQQPYAQQYPPQYAPQYQNYQPAPPAQPSAFSKWMKREGLVPLILKGVAALNLLVSFILAIAFAANIADVGSMLSYFGGSSRGGSGAFGVFLVVFFVGMISSALLYGVSEMARDLAAIRKKKVDDDK